MIHTKWLILGAGPAGLTFANRLIQNGENDIIVLEKESSVGGLCRSVDVDGSPFDIGGGHFLDVRRPHVNEFLFGFMPESEWDTYERDSRIDMGDYMIGSPIEANIWQMPEDTQKEYLESISEAGCNKGEPMPDKFTEWIDWKLGKCIARDYMLPYNMKMFGDNLDQLGTYWLAKLPNVSYEETLQSCKEHKPYGTQPGHAQFYYPKEYGYGELWIRMGKALGDKLVLKEAVTSLDAANKTVNDKYEADNIICTIPWPSISNISGINGEVAEIISNLKSTAVVTEYHSENLDTPAQWIYCPDPKLDYHRILVRHNFCPASKGYWTETNLTRYHADDSRDYFINKYAYPLNTIGKNEKMALLLDFMKEHHIFGLGRWGEWQHYNSDVVVDLSLQLADKLGEKNAK